jgi:tetratricopeptide (TPR) repeat protein
MGSVFEVRSRLTGASYAAKTVNRPEDQAARERFRREAELLARVDRHAGIVKVHAFGEAQDGTLYLILDLVRGESLEAVMTRERRLEPRRAAEIARGVAAALGHAHALGITHRDVKPANILLEQDGTPRLTDFGLATARDVERLTRTGTFLGTMSYCSPEQATGSPTTPASDVFALGCVLFHALTGRTPIVAETSVEHVARLAGDEPLDPVRGLEPEVPKALDAIVARALAKDPEERYADGGALAQDLERFLAGEDVTFVPARRRRRIAWLVLAGSAVTAGALATVVAVTIHGRRESARSALAAAREALARARSLSARLNPSPGEVSLARDEMGRARRERDLAASAGAEPDETLDRDLAAILPDLALTEARGALARGDAAAALAALDAVPGAPEALTVPARIVRARALLRLGRPREALREVERRGGIEALEIEGDACMALDEPVPAARAYSRALELAPPAAARRLRARRGGAASLAGDEATARGDLTVLLGDRVALPRDAEAIAAIASIAPALYRRALAATSDEARERDLDAAGKLGPPPPALRTEVARAWIAQATADGERWNTGRLQAPTLTDVDVERFHRILALARRARAIDPTASLRGLEQPLQLLRSVVTGQGDVPRIEAIARALLVDFPDEPHMLYIFAWSKREASGDAFLEGRAALFRALDTVEDFAPGDEPPRAFLVDVLTAIFNPFLVRDGGQSIDMERLRRGVERADSVDSWRDLANLFWKRLHDRARALECLDRAVTARSAVGRLPSPEETLARRVDRLVRAGDLDAALAIARDFHEKFNESSGGVETLARLLLRARLWDEALALVDLARVEGRLLWGVIRALSKRGRAAEARALAARQKPSDEAVAPTEALLAVDEAERRIDALLGEGKRDEALELARETQRTARCLDGTALLASVLNRCERPEEVLRLVDRDKEQAPRAFVERGLALVKLGKLDAARQLVETLETNELACEARPIAAALAAAGKVQR